MKKTVPSTSSSRVWSVLSGCSLVVTSDASFSCLARRLLHKCGHSLLWQRYHQCIECLACTELKCALEVPPRSQQRHRREVSRTGSSSRKLESAASRGDLATFLATFNCSRPVDNGGLCVFLAVTEPRTKFPILQSASGSNHRARLVFDFHYGLVAVAIRLERGLPEFDLVCLRGRFLRIQRAHRSFHMSYYTVCSPLAPLERLPCPTSDGVTFPQCHLCHLGTTWPQAFAFWAPSPACGLHDEHLCYVCCSQCTLGAVLSVWLTTARRIPQ